MGDGAMRKLMAVGAGTAIMAVTLGTGLAACGNTVYVRARPAGAARSAHATAAPLCGIRWGSTAKSAGKMVASPVVRVRAGRHACFDRLVVVLGAGQRPGYHVRYVARASQDPSGRAIGVRGAAKLRITVLAPATRNFPVARRQLAKLPGFSTFRQVAGAGSADGSTALGLGVRARLPFRAFTLRGPGHGWRLVIDVAHRWSR
jgi:hypothetical protein